MIAAMANIRETHRSILIVVLQPDNLERMKQADAATLEAISEGGILQPPLYPLNFSVLIAYEEDEAELMRRAQGDSMDFLRWLERGRVFIKGKDGTENTVLLKRGMMT